MNILETIAVSKRDEVAALRRDRGAASLREGALSQPPPRPFLEVIQRPGKISLIAELKKASPSKGILRQDFQVASLAASYARGGAQALSVLTDTPFFQGRLSFLREAREASGLPILRKDFILDPLQVDEAREAGADAILLITALLEKSSLSDLQRKAWDLGMVVLVEVHNRAELDLCLEVGVKLLGINNRDLKDFRLDLQTSLGLLKACPPELAVVSESGILTRGDVERLKKAGACAVLVGEALMTKPDPGAAARELMPE